MKIILLFATCLIMFSCKNSTSVSSPSTTVSKTATNPQNNSASEIIYDVILSFTSMGEGIDDSTKGKIDTLIMNFNNQNHLMIKPGIVNWGREGERDYNFLLKNLSTVKKKEFISAIKETISDSEITIMHLNQEAVHKR